MKIYLTPKTLKKIIKMLVLFILACILIFYSETLNVKAYTIANNSIYVCDSSDNVTTGKYNYITDGVSYTANFGTTYQGVMTSFSTRFNAQIQQGNSYTLVLNANTGDWRNIDINSIKVLGSIGSHCSSNINAYTITSVTATYYKITITFTANSTANYTQIVIYNSDGSAITGISNFKIDSMVLTDLGNSNTSDIINNQNQTTQTIIENDKQNTQDIIDNNDSNTQDIIDNQDKNNEELKDTINDNFNSCRESNNLLDISKYDSYKNGILLNNLTSGKTYTFSSNAQFSWFKISYDINGVSYVQYDGTDIFNYTFVAPENVNNMYLFLGSSIDYSNNTSWFVSNAEMMLNEGSSSQKYEPYGEICSSKLDDLNENQQATNDKLDNLNDSLNNNDIGGADDEANNFFNDFESNDFGLSDIITLPLTTIQSITSKSCTPLNLTLPFVNKSFELPCMTTIYSKFEPFYSIYQTITFGVISYWVCVQIYAMVKGFKDPAKDEIEVMDL